MQKSSLVLIQSDQVSPRIQRVDREVQTNQQSFDQIEEKP